MDEDEEPAHTLTLEELRSELEENGFEVPPGSSLEDLQEILALLQEAEEDEEMLMSSSSDEPPDLDAGASPEAERVGCPHYERRCRIVAPCCGEVFGCRFCHDEVKFAGEPDPKKRHEIVRFEIAEVVCLECEERQPTTQQCRKCNTVMGEYFCNVCKFYDNKLSKKPYHCDGCGICRVGGRENFWHCHKCNSCQPSGTEEQHKCFDGGMRQNCPICMEFLFDSRQAAQSLRCGHMIHVQCFKELISSAGLPRCPMCNVSLLENNTMARVWTSIDADIAAQPMPAKYRNISVRILCNDCHQEGSCTFHFLGLKCPTEECGSYNTRRIGEEDIEEAGQESEEEEQQPEPEPESDP